MNSPDYRMQEENEHEQWESEVSVAKTLRQQDLHTLMVYDCSTGIFQWLKKRRGIQVGVGLGCDNGFGYLRITVLGRSYYAHRLAWLYSHGVWPETIDHINGNKSDNRLDNLRCCSQFGNNQNKIFPQSNNKAKVLGVSWHKQSKKWQAHICVYKQRKYLGLFNSIEAASSAYIKEKELVSI